MRSVALSDDDFARAALAARAQAFRHEQHAKNGNGEAQLYLDQARRWRALAECFEEARTASPQS